MKRRCIGGLTRGLISAIGCGFVLYFSKGIAALDTIDYLGRHVRIVFA